MSNQNNQGLRDPIWQFIWGALAAVLAIIAIIVGILALPQAVPARNFISHTFAGTSPTSEIPTVPPATPTPTPSPKVIPENLNIACLTCNSNMAYSLKLDSIEIDSANQQTIVKFTIIDIGSWGCDVVFDKLEFQDDSATIFKAQNVGQTLGSLATGNPLKVNSIFNLRPQPRIHYLLSTTLHCSYNALDYKTQDFVFN